MDQRARRLLSALPALAAALVLLSAVWTQPSPVVVEEVVEYGVRGRFVLVNRHNVTLNDFVYIALPQNTSFQESYVVRVEPPLLRLVRDEDGNVMGVVRVVAKPGEKVAVDVEYRVVVRGYRIRVDLTRGEWPPLSVAERYTSKTAYWNTYNLTLVGLAYSAAYADSPLETASRLASWVLPRISYTVNLGRAGSDRALIRTFGGYAVRGDCVEVADVYVTMARALGLPARTAYGVLLTSYSQRMWLNMSTVGEEGEALLQHWGGHMWPQVYIPPYGWVDVDMLDGMSPNVGVYSARHIVFGVEETKYYGSALTSSCIPSYLDLEYVEYEFRGVRR